MLVVVFRWGVGHDAASGSTSSARSRAGSRSSCSRCSSASRWTTRCSSSRACARRGTTAPTTRRAVAHGLERTGPDHHRRGDHHVRRVLGLRRRADRRPAGVRARPRGRDLRRRDDRPLAARAEPDGDLRPLELVAAAPLARLVRVAPSPLERTLGRARPASSRAARAPSAARLVRLIWGRRLRPGDPAAARRRVHGARSRGIGALRVPRHLGDRAARRVAGRSCRSAFLVRRDRRARVRAAIGGHLSDHVGRRP